MPDLNLEPHQYSRIDPRTGKMVLNKSDEANVRKMVDTHVPQEIRAPYWDLLSHVRMADAWDKPAVEEYIPARYETILVKCRALLKAAGAEKSYDPITLPLYDSVDLMDLVDLVGKEEEGEEEATSAQCARCGKEKRALQS